MLASLTPKDARTLIRAMAAFRVAAAERPAAWEPGDDDRMMSLDRYFNRLVARQQLEIHAERARGAEDEAVGFRELDVDAE